MTYLTKADLVIIGGGPAGMAAALEANSAGVSCSVIDERPALGGQIHRQFYNGFNVYDPSQSGREYQEGQRLISEVTKSKIEVITSATVWGVWDKQVAFVQDGNLSRVVESKMILLATGVQDRPFVCPGWTLPGVITAGAAKTLVKYQRILPGKRILMAGSGPLVLAFSAQLSALGANIVGVIEAAGAPKIRDIIGLALQARGNEALIRDAIQYQGYLLRHQIPLQYSTILMRVEGDGAVQRAVTARVDKDWRIIPATENVIEVDAICLGYGFLAASELSRLCGCRQMFDENLGGHIPIRDEWLRTSVPGILAAGDGSGVAGWQAATLEGRLAGITAALDLGKLSLHQATRRARDLRIRLRRMEQFRQILRRMYPVGQGIYEVATPETIVCRCEEVTVSELSSVLDNGVTDPNILKGFTRAGMGRCQMRNCGSQIMAMCASRSGISIAQVPPITVRPPVKPVLIGSIAENLLQLPAEIAIT